MLYNDTAYLPVFKGFISSVLFFRVRFLYVFYYILDNHDVETGIEGQKIVSDGELKNIPLIKCEKIGQGGFATVYRCENKKFNIEIAMKKVEYFDKKEKKVDALHKEMEILSKLKHKRIVRYYGIIQDKDSVSILMEYAKGGTIRKLISDKGALCEKKVGKYCQQILDGLAYLHETKIVHRDLKCANILLDNRDNCKLTDFGISKHSHNVRSMSGCHTDTGTVYWMSPECIEGKKYGWKSDIWSFGVTVLEMLNKEPPYRELNPHAAMLKIVEEEMAPFFPLGTSDHCILFTKMCFQKDPKTRPSAKDLLEHEFISVWNP